MVSLSTCHLALDGNLVLIDLVKSSRSSDQVGFISEEGGLHIEEKKINSR